MRILITGSKGQLGQALQRKLIGSNHECMFADRDELDLRDEEAVRNIVLSQKPQVVINCAAYTAVDKAENELQAAVEINQDAVRVLGEACTTVNATLIHISTDYVYHNGLNRPLQESDPTNPKSVYARTKLAGEKEALSACAKTVIVRTSWVYGLEGHNFLRTMVKLGKDRDRLTIVSDQVGAPTFADDLAEALITLVGFSESGNLVPGIYNYANEGVASWYDFAYAIMQLYAIECEVAPIPTSEYPTPAERPSFSLLDLRKSRQAGLPMRHWRDALADFHTRDTTIA